MTQKGFAALPLLLILIVISGIIVGSRFINSSLNFWPKADSEQRITKRENLKNAFDVTGVRSVTYYINGKNQPMEVYTRLIQDLPKIKEAGFNTVLLVSSWGTYNPKPLNEPNVFDYDNFEVLKKTLSLLRDNQMKAILPLNYFETAPERIMNQNNVIDRPYRTFPTNNTGSIAGCDWLTNDQKYRSFINYTNVFLEQIEDYADSVYPMVFAEGTECNIAGFSWTNVEKRRELSHLLRNTLGFLPNALKDDLRSKFTIGFYDAALTRLSVQAGDPKDTPIFNPNPFDFVANGGYYEEGNHSDPLLRESINRAISEFRTAFPKDPLLIFEFGQSTCSLALNLPNMSLEENQKRVLTEQIKLFQAQNLGFNIWAWQDTPYSGSCPVFSGTTIVDLGYGLGLTRADGSYKPAVAAVKEVLNQLPVGADGGSNCTQLIGWACDGSDYGQDLSIHFYKDGPAYGNNPGQMIGGTFANIEVNKSTAPYCGGKTAKWYRIDTPAELKDGVPHTLYIYAIDYPHNPGRFNPLVHNSPITLNCPAQ